MNYVFATICSGTAKIEMRHPHSVSSGHAKDPRQHKIEYDNDLSPDRKNRDMTLEKNGRSKDDHENSTSTRSGEIHNGETEEDHKSTKIMSTLVPDIRLFHRRWLQLALYVVCSTTTNMQWFQYAVCSNIMQKYWDVSSLSIQWTSMIYEVVYLLGVFPATYLMRRLSLRWTILIGAGGTCIGAWIKVFSVSPDLFAVTFIGQTVVAVAQIFVTTLPGRLAAYWFGPKEVATATTIACYGIQAGASIGFVVTTHAVQNHDNIVDIGDDLHQFFITMAIVCTVVFVLILLLFQDQPSLPPSITRALQRTIQEMENTEGFCPQVKRILTNGSFIVLWNTYGAIVCIYGTMSTVLNSLYLARFKDAEVEVGNLGLLGAVAGAISSICLARILDKTKKFRLITTSLCISTLLSQIMLAISMMMGVKWLVFVSGGLWGASLFSYGFLSLELVVETTYPEAEQVVMGIFSIASQFYGAVVTLITGRMIEMYGDMAGHACMIVTIAFGTILATSTKLDLRRSKAARVAGYRDVKLRVLDPEKTESIKS